MKRKLPICTHCQTPYEGEKHDCIYQQMEDAEVKLEEARTVVRQLLNIAKLAMPDTYFATDARVKRARKFLR